MWFLLPLLFLLSAKSFSALSTKDMVKMDHSAETVLHPGETKGAKITLTVVEGLHVQSNPASQPNLIPTTLKVQPKGTIEVGSPSYPVGKPYRLEGATHDIMTYDGTFEITIPITANPNAGPSKIQLSGTVRYQACNPKTCFFPTTLPIKIPVRIEK